MNKDNFDIGLTIQSQYSASPHIVALVNGFWSCLDPSADIELIFNKMINPITAEGFGLDVFLVEPIHLLPPPPVFCPEVPLVYVCSRHTWAWRSLPCPGALARSRGCIFPRSSPAL